MDFPADVEPGPRLFNALGDLGRETVQLPVPI